MVKAIIVQMQVNSSPYNSEQHVGATNHINRNGKKMNRKIKTFGENNTAERPSWVCPENDNVLHVGDNRSDCDGEEDFKDKKTLVRRN